MSNGPEDLGEIALRLHLDVTGRNRPKWPERRGSSLASKLWDQTLLRNIRSVIIASCKS